MLYARYPTDYFNLRIQSRRMMKKKLLSICLLFSLTASLFIGCGITSGGDSVETIPNAIEISQDTLDGYEVPDDKYRTYYEIFVYSYCDSDGDGIGDLAGVTSKLDYIQDLGFTGIWLMPIMPSPSYHKYDTTDYYDVDEQYGTLEDMKTLLTEAHARGIRVIIDLAMNHSSSEHPYFKEAYEYIQSLGEGEEPDASVCKYVDWYNFTREYSDGYSEVEGTDWYYESRFVYSMPDLNWDNPEVAEEFDAVAKFWLDLGVDGFRLDAVKYYDYGNDDRNIEILAGFNDYVKSINSDAYIVCEEWDSSASYSKYYASGVDSLFDFDFGDKTGIISKVVSGSKSASAYGKGLVTEEELFSSFSSDYINAPFYTNHDMARSAGFYAGDYSEAMTKIGNAMNILMAGNVFVYYGEELGMKGSGADENKRAPMYWSTDSSSEGMCVGPPNMDDVEMKYGSLEEQSQDETSIYNYVKDTISIRNSVPAIARGTTTYYEANSTDTLCLISRSYEGEEIYIAFNISQESTSLDLSTVVDEPQFLGQLYTGEDVATYVDGSVNMPAYSVVVFK